MKQVHPSYSFVASTKTITLTGLNIDQDQLLLIVNATRGVQYFNFADSSLRATVTSGSSTTVVLADASTTGHANGDALVIYYDDQVTSQVVSGTVTANPGTGAFTVSGTVGLDPASLAALENVTVTVGSSISGTVTVSNIDFAAANNDVRPNKAVQLGFYEQAGSGDFRVVNNDDAAFPVQGFGKSNVNDGTFYPIPVCESGNNDYLGRHIPIGFKNSQLESTLVASDSPLPIEGTVTASASNIPVYNPGDTIFDDGLVGVIGKVFVANDYNGNNVEILVGPGNTEFNGGSGRVGVELINKSGVSLVVTGPALNTWVSNTVTANVGGTVNANIRDGSGNNLTSTSIGGLNRLNVTLSSAGSTGTTAPAVANLYGGTDGTNLRAISVDSSGRSVVTGSLSISNFPASQTVAGTVTANISGTVPVSGTFWQATQPVSLTSTTVTVSSLPASTVTVSALPSGALTTRFGSVTTANTAQLTAAVTNTSRKYLLAQNISAGTVTIGIGFSPTTTQGIQLTAGGGLTFDTFCPTGAVYWLGAVTGAAFTILEG